MSNNTNMTNEVEVQNRVSECYENIRYRNSYSRFYHTWWIRKMLSQVNSNGLLLDNGCGIGILSDVQPARSIVGIDISSNMVKMAKTRNSKVVQGDSEKLPFRSDSFDVIFCKGLLHHLQRPVQAIAEMHRVLRKRGEVVMVDTNRSIINFLPRFLAKGGDRFSANHKNFGAAEYVRSIETRFEVEAVKFFGYIAYPLIGFPDLLDFSKLLPIKHGFVESLIKIDQILEHIPLLRKQSWAILIKARKA